MAAGRSSPTPEARGSGREDQPHVRGQGQRPGGATLRPRLVAVAERSYLASKARVGGLEEIPRVGGRGRRPRGATPRRRPGAAA